MKKYNKFYPVSCIEKYLDWHNNRLYDISLNYFKINTNLIMVWDVNKKHVFQYDNKDFKKLNLKKIDKTIIQTDEDDYIKYHLFRQCLNLVKTLYATCSYLDEHDFEYYAKLEIKKIYPNYFKRINELYPDKRDVVSSLENVLRHYLNDVTLSKEDVAMYSYAYCQKFGYVKKHRFKDVWLFLTESMKLPGKECLVKYKI